MHKGIEVEGKFKGLKSIFLDAEEFLEWNKLTDVLNQHTDIEQLYISDHRNVLDLSANVSLNVLAERYHVTVERTYVPRYINVNVNIMLVIDNESFWNLRGNDQIKISKDLTVYSVPLSGMYKTVPSDFDGDITL